MVLCEVYPIGMKLLQTKGEKTMKLLQHKQTGMYRIVGNYGTSEPCWTKELALKDYARVKTNAIKRERNQILAEMSGTSARAARLDMGIGG